MESAENTAERPPANLPWDLLHLSLSPQGQKEGESTRTRLWGQVTANLCIQQNFKCLTSELARILKD